MYPEPTKRQGHRPILYVVIAFVAFRLMALLLMKPGGFIGTLSDFEIYRLLVSYASQGFYPAVDYWIEYPPLFPWILVGIYRLALLLPAWREPGFWFKVLLPTVLMLAETANLILIYLIGKRLYGERIALRVAWVYTLLFIPLLMMLGRFDALGLTFLLLALYLTLIRRPLASGVAAGVGLLVKLWSIIVVPVAFWREPTWRRRALLISTTLLAVVAMALPFVLLNPQLFASSWTINLKRTSWQTVWALLIGYTGWGLPGGANRFDPAQAGASQPPSNLPWTVISLGFALFYLWLWTRRIDWQDDRRAVAFTGLTMNLVMVYLKGYSPQFLVWLLPFVILLLPGLRGITYALLLSVVNIVEYPFYFSMLRNQPWVLTCTVLARTGLLIVLAVEYGRIALSQPISERWSRRICLGAVVVLAIVGLVAAPFAYSAYYENRLAASDHRAMVETLRSEAQPGARVIVGGDEESGAQGVFDNVYAFLQRKFDVTSVQTDWWYPDWEPRMERAVGGYEQIWLYAPPDSPLHAWLDEHYTPIATYDLDGWRLSGWDTR
jgi:hypothetical protein